jgi:hypothetical protein
MKLVMIINQELPLGLIANTAAVLGLSVGDRVTGLTGPDITDGAGRIHAGITKVNIPVLGASSMILQGLYERLLEENDSDIQIIDFNTVAQRCKNYDDYTRELAACGQDAFQYLGLCLYGQEQKINRLTGNLRLLR